MGAKAQELAQLGPGEDLTAQHLASKVLTTVYMGTVNSSTETRQRADQLAVEIGSDHLNANVDIAVDAMAKLFSVITGKTPKFKAGSQTQQLCHCDDRPGSSDCTGIFSL